MKFQYLLIAYLYSTLQNCLCQYRNKKEIQYFSSIPYMALNKLFFGFFVLCFYFLPRLSFTESIVCIFCNAIQLEIRAPQFIFDLKRKYGWWIFTCHIRFFYLRYCRETSISPFESGSELLGNKLPSFLLHPPLLSNAQCVTKSYTMSTSVRFG